MIATRYATWCNLNLSWNLFKPLVCVSFVVSFKFQKLSNAIFRQLEISWDFVFESESLFSTVVAHITGVNVSSIVIIERDHAVTLRSRGRLSAKPLHARAYCNNGLWTLRNIIHIDGVKTQHVALEAERTARGKRSGERCLRQDSSPYRERKSNRSPQSLIWLCVLREC